MVTANMDYVNNSANQIKQYQVVYDLYLSSLIAFSIITLNGRFIHKIISSSTLLSLLLICCLYYIHTTRYVFACAM